MMRQRRTKGYVQQVDDKITNRIDSELSHYHNNDDKNHPHKRSAQDAPKKNVQYIIDSIVITIILQTLALWICSSIVVASANTWVAVPFIGYCRWDIAIMFLTVQITLIYITWTRSSSRWITMGVVLFLLFGLPYLPEMYRPMIYLRPLADMIEDDLTMDSSSEGVSVHSTGFSDEDAASLVDMTMRYKDRWTHVDMAQSLAYFIFGSSINFYQKQQRMKYRGKGYTFKYGVKPTNEVFKHESSFRLHYRDDMADVQLILHEQLAPKLRQVIANTLGINHDQVVFGNEIGGGYDKSHLGMPAIGIIFPHVLWHWIQNPHDDGVYKNKIPTNIVPCKKADDVTTFLIPLTAPEGSGLRDWKKEKDGNVVMNETKYEVGNVYTFAASNTLHAIGPLPYYEWKRSSYRINIQAFGVQCDDLKWYIYR